jgi:3-isopropylmalate/(R)-2-methylmalate dehydratase large subunit
LRQGEKSGKGRKAFFSEEKKQKTFIFGDCVRIAAMASIVGGARKQKFFGSFFSKKNILVSSMPRTLFEKIWQLHEIVQRPDGQSLLWIDRHYLHEGSFVAFGQLEARGATVAYPDLCIAVADHYAPTRSGPMAPDIADMMARLTHNTAVHGIRFSAWNAPDQGIVHVIGPERGLTLPGLIVVCGDSHTSTHGALGAIGFGIGASEAAHVLITQTLWQKRPKLMRITVDGTLGPGIGAKDLALSIIAHLGADGGRGLAIEYAGQAVRALSMEARLTLCNLTIECGARSGMVAPDTTTFAYLRGRPHAPPNFAAACDIWAKLPSDPGAEFHREITLNAADIAPIVTWGTSPEDALPITASVPDPARIDNPGRAAAAREAADYMGLHAGQKLDSITVDRVFIGSCTNSRIDDLRAAAAIIAGRRAVIPGLVSPGSAQVKRQAEEEGLARIFTDAGLEWGDPGCSMCVGMNGDLVRPGERCASTTNRNFRGRQGPGARTHLMSPAMAAAAALTGRLTDVRKLQAGRA